MFTLTYRGGSSLEAEGARPATQPQMMNTTTTQELTEDNLTSYPWYETRMPLYYQPLRIPYYLRLLTTCYVQAQCSDTSAKYSSTISICAAPSHSLFHSC